MGLIPQSVRSGSGASRNRALCLLGLLTLLAIPLVAAEPGDDRHPLEPVDLSSPRATLRTFLDGIDRAWELYEARQPGYREVFLDAMSCIDSSELLPRFAEQLTTDSTLLLKEVLDRLELPPIDTVPDLAEVEAAGLTSWTIPHTEIELRRVAEGPREGAFLFSPETVARSREFFDRVRHLPYRPGRSGAHYDELRFGSESRWFAALVSKLPEWSKRELGGLLGWQWASLVLLVVLGFLLSVGAFALGRRLAGSGRPFFAAVGPFFAPLMLISLRWLLPAIAPWRLELGGTGALLFGTTLVVLSLLGGAWLIAVGFHRIALIVIRLSGAEERPLHQQLILVTARGLSVLAIAALLFVGGQALGIPMSAMLTGLGVGGLAVALSAQSTLENLIGGINLYADRPVRIGDFCKFGDDLGVIEAIGLRSTRIRTQARTVVTVPNSSLASMQLENLSLRDRNLLRFRLRLDQRTEPDEVEALLGRLRERFAEDERVAEEPLRIRLLDIGSDALEVELFSHVLTSDWDEYLAIREELLLDALRIVGAAGARLALPTERHEIVGAPPPSGGDS